MAKKRYPAPKVPYVQARHSGGKNNPTLLVMHSTVTTSAKGAANGVAQMWHGANSPVTSAHYAIDAGTTIQCVYDHTVAYHCGYNDGSIGLEMCDDPSKPKSRWDNADETAVLERTADLAATLCLAYGIRDRFLSDQELEAWGRNKTAKNGGIVTHAQMSRVFKRSTHWDPGEWPSEKFLDMVKENVIEKAKTPLPPTKTDYAKRTTAALAVLAVIIGTIFGVKSIDGDSSKIHPVVGATRNLDVIVWNEKSFPHMTNQQYFQDFQTGLSLGGKNTAWLMSEISYRPQVVIYNRIVKTKGLKSYGVTPQGGDTAITTRGIEKLKGTRIQLADKPAGSASPPRFGVYKGSAKSPAVTFISLHLVNGCFPKNKHKSWYAARCRALQEQIKLVKKTVNHLVTAGSAVVVGGDYNTGKVLVWRKGQRTIHNRLMQLAVIPARKQTVELYGKKVITGLHTDHSLLAGKVKITQK